MVLGLLKAMSAPGDPPPSAKHPREMMARHNRAASIRLWPWRFGWRHNRTLQHFYKSIMIVGGIWALFYAPVLLSPERKRRLSHEMRHELEHMEKENRGIHQRNADAAYFASKGMYLPKKV